MSGDKTRRTVSLDEEVDEYLDNDEVNASALVNQLVKNHVTSGGDERAMLELRREQLKSEVQSAENTAEQKRSELETVNEKLSEYEDDIQQVLDEAADVLEGITLDEDAYDNPGVENWADKADLPVDEFVERLRERRE